MKRYCICRIVEDPDGGLSPKVALYPDTNMRAWFVPGGQWCIAQFATRDLTPIEADNQIIVLPDTTLDMTWGSLPAGTRSNVTRRIDDTGLSTAAFTPQATIRELLMDLINQCQINPHTKGPEAGDIEDVE